jgi:hypothetical protein
METLDPQERMLFLSKQISTSTMEVAIARGFQKLTPQPLNARPHCCMFTF